MSKERTVLIVEDERIVALDLKLSLEDMGFRVLAVASSSGEAIAAAEVERPNLVIMDIRIMGDLDGIELAAVLRARHSVPIVYLTANADAATLKRALETEPNGYLAKPFSPKSLRTTLEVALRRHEDDQALKSKHEDERRRFAQQTSELTELLERFRDESIVDPLTGLYNRRHLDFMLQEQLRIAVRDSRPTGFIIIDVDRFKYVNDTFGHVTGDIVLRGVADLVRSSIRADDVPCRYGGEEFAVVVPGAALRDTVNLSERLRQGVELLNVRTRSGMIQITASFGVSAFPEHGDTSAELIAAADGALYVAKNAGRNRVVAAAL